MSEPVDVAKLGMVIRQMREQRPENLTHFAKRIGITKSNLSRVERGLGEPGISTLVAISGGLGVNVDQLLTAVPVELIPCPKCSGSGWVAKEGGES